MTVYVTPEHDTTMVNSKTEEIMADMFCEQVQTACNIGDSQFNNELHSDCYGEDYADCVMSDLIMDA